MKKSFIAVIILGFVLLGANVATAGGLFNDNSTTYNYEPQNDNYNTNVNANLIGIKTQNDIKNTNKNSNSNCNRNNNSAVGVGIGGEGGSAAASLQNENVLQQEQSQSIQAHTGDISIKNEAAYNHIQSGVGAGNAAVAERTPVSRIRVDGDVLTSLSSISMKQAKLLGSAAKGAEVVKAMLYDRDVQTDRLLIKTSNNKDAFAGYIYCLGNGSSDVTRAGCDGLAAKAAMEAGMTHIIPYNVSSSEAVTGKQSGISLGGSASIMMSDSGRTVVAPGAMLGFSKATSASVRTPDVIYMVFSDENLIEK